MNFSPEEIISGHIEEVKDVISKFLISSALITPQTTSTFTRDNITISYCCHDGEDYTRPKWLKVQGKTKKDKKIYRLSPEVLLALHDDILQYESRLKILLDPYCKIAHFKTLRQIGIASDIAQTMASRKTL